MMLWNGATIVFMRTESAETPCALRNQTNLIFGLSISIRRHISRFTVPLHDEMLNNENIMERCYPSSNCTRNRGHPRTDRVSCETKYLLNIENG
ncbi:hypothetical protein GHT06_021061 [Daphnia sinensis]|uniref:Uncharacterized protein n=1 Tax=Daphnia sinensis TaxID=1820382 RepID=A0AAD5KIK2_9CRUS|nr:hypothetical protein GHT06_021061 [Daphnia sinensis]